MEGRKDRRRGREDGAKNPRSTEGQGRGGQDGVWTGQDNAFGRHEPTTGRGQRGESHRSAREKKISDPELPASGLSFEATNLTP